KSDPENRGKRREEITQLDLSKGKTGGENLFNGEPKNLFGDLKELYTKRKKLRKLQIELSLKLKDSLANVLTKYFFKNHRMIVEGKDVMGYYSKNLTDLRNGLGSDTEGHKILDQILSVQKEIIDLEKELESTTTPQVELPPPYNYAIQIAHQKINSIETLDRIRYSAHIVTINDESKTCNSIDGMKLDNRLEVRNNVSESIETLDRIRYSAHVTINDESKTCNNIDGMKLGNRSEIRNNVSEYISVYSTIFQGPSDIAITEAERLFSLLKNQKDKIDNILDSHAVYAVGPKFQNDYSMPYIACWVANPLTVSIMEKISGLFNHEFEVAYHLVKVNGNDGGPKNTSIASGNISGEFSITNSDAVEREGNDENSDDNDDDSEYHDADSGEDDKTEDGGDEDGGDDGGDSDDDGDDNDGESDDEVDGKILISSEGKVEFEDRKLIEIKNRKKFQSFNITMKLWANVKPNVKNNANSTLEFEIDLSNCGVTDFLSNQCPSLNKFICYHLDSLEICASPIRLKSDDTCIIIQKKKHNPHKANNNITSTKVHEKDCSLSSKATFAIGKKKSRSSTATTKEWTMRDEFSETTGNKWSYSFTDSDVYDTLDNRLSINTDLHKGHWYVKNKVKGFRITITQVMGSTNKRNVYKYLYATPKLIKEYPRIVHQLEISFTNIEKLNSDFKKHAKKEYHDGGEAITVTSKNNNQPLKENGDEFIKRKLFQK
ncbi:14969_t:CDS:1, partial [Racocetra persica]